MSSGASAPAVAARARLAAYAAMAPAIDVWPPGNPTGAVGYSGLRRDLLLLLGEVRDVVPDPPTPREGA